MDDLVLLHEVTLNDYKTIGKKAAYVAEMYNKKYNVPPGFLINGSLFEKFVEMAGIKQTISSILGSGASESEKSQKIQETIINVQFPEEFSQFLYENYLALNVMSNDDANSLLSNNSEPYVALRVSSTSEHVHDVFFLNVKGKERFLTGIKNCWASLFSEHNLKYKRFKPTVLVQKMVNSKKSGFVYTVNPLTGNPNELVIHLCSGLGSGIADAHIAPSRYVVNKTDMSILHSELVDQVVQLNLDMAQEKTVKVNLDEPIKNIIDDFFVREMSKLSKKIESRFSKPQKISFGIDRQLFLLGSKDLNIEEKEPQIHASNFVPTETIEPVQSMGQTIEQPQNIETQPQQSFENVQQNTEPNTFSNNAPVDSMAGMSSSVEELSKNVTPEAPGHISSFDELISKVKENSIADHVESEAEKSLNEQFSQIDQYEAGNPVPSMDPTQAQAVPQNQNDFVQASPEQSSEMIGMQNPQTEQFNNTTNVSETNYQMPEPVQEQSGIVEVQNGNVQGSTEQTQEQPVQMEKESFMKEFMNNKPEVTFGKAISLNSSMIVVSCDMAILHALKGKYRSVFNKDSHNYFNELINELKLSVNVPYENELKQIRKLRTNFLEELVELTPNEMAFVVEYTQKFLSEF